MRKKMLAPTVGHRARSGTRTFLLQEHSALCDDYGHVAVNETLSIVVGEGDSDVCVLDADLERDTEDTLLCFL